MITQVNKGVCQWRATNNQPPYFVNWQQDGQNKYQFFNQVAPMYALFERLKNSEKQHNENTNNS